MAKTGIETVTRLRAPAAAGRFGATGTPLEQDIPDCTIIPRTSSEDTQDGDTVIIGLTLVAPPLTDLVATDHVRVRGLVYEIEGDPGDYRTKRGKAKAVIAALRRVTG